MILQTDRLILREFNLADTGFIIELLNSPGWIEFIGDRNVKTEEQAVNYLENGPLKSYRQNGFGLSMVELKDGTPVGMCGILKRAELDTPDIGFAFLPEHSGKGYAYEVANATLLYAKDKFRLEKIAAITIASNERSILLLKKLGFSHSGVFVFPGTTEELLLFRS